MALRAHRRGDRRGHLEQHRAVGSGWTGRILAGPDGRVYHITPAGDLHWFRYTGSGWDNGGWPRLMGTGWGRYLTYRNSITVDADGLIYTIDDIGILRSYRFDEASWSWEDPAGTEVAYLPDGYSIFAAGRKVLNVSGNNTLRRYQYVEPSQQWTQYGHVVSTAWSQIQARFSPGGDVVYVVGYDNRLRWYRYDADLDRWDNDGAGRQIGTGWDIFDGRIAATTNACSTPAPVVGPTTPQGVDPTRPLQSAGVGASMAYFYVDSAGQAIRGGPWQDERPIGGPTFGANLSVVWRDVPFLAGVDGTGTVWRNEGGEAGYWEPMGGSLRWVKLASPISQGRPDAIGMDASGRLWWWPQRWKGWRALPAPALFDDEVSVGSLSPHPYGVATVRGSGGATRYWYVTQSLGVYEPRFGLLPDGGAYDLPAASDVWRNPPLLVARHRASGQPFALFGTSDATFDPAWTAMPPLALAAQPLAATEISSGSIAVVAVGADGYPYATNRVPGSRQFHPWQRIGQVTVATAPTAQWVWTANLAITFRGSDGRVYHYQGSQGVGTDPLTLSGGPVTG